LDNNNENYTLHSLENVIRVRIVTSRLFLASSNRKYFLSSISEINTIDTINTAGFNLFTGLFPYV